MLRVFHTVGRVRECGGVMVICMARAPGNGARRAGVRQTWHAGGLAAGRPVGRGERMRGWGQVESRQTDAYVDRGRL
jgi:hypothetical protein